MWDLDFPSAPPLAKSRCGKLIDAVAQAGKDGYIYVPERETGKSLFPMKEIIVAASTVDGEMLAKLAMQDLPGPMRLNLPADRGMAVPCGNASHQTMIAWGSVSIETRDRRSGVSDIRVRRIQYLLQHPEVSYCDKCLDDLASGVSGFRPWGVMSIERADGICSRCGLFTTVATGRRTETLAEIAARRAAAQPGPVTQVGSPADTPDANLSHGRALLQAKVETLESLRADIDKTIAALRSELEQLDNR